MSETLKERLQAAMKDAMRARDKERLGAIRMAINAVQQRELDEQTALGDAEVTAVLDKLVKQRREAAEQYRAGNRPELAEREEFEAGVLGEFLPAPLSDSELDDLIHDAIAAAGASSVREMGKVMGQLKPKVQGRADMSHVSARVKAALQG